MTFTPEEQAFIDAFWRKDDAPTAVRVKVNGQLVRLKKGKAVWRTIAGAKGALQHQWRYAEWPTRPLLTPEFIDHLVARGILEFVTS